MWRKLKIFFAKREISKKASTRPSFLYHDLLHGNIEQGLHFVEGHFKLFEKEYNFNTDTIWEEDWPPQIKHWLYSFIWLRDLHAFGTNDARLKARHLIHSWAKMPPKDKIASDPTIIGKRISYILGHYEFCLMTAQDHVKKTIMALIQKEGRMLSALLPLQNYGWESFSSLRGLLAAFMAFPNKKIFYQRFQKYFPQELERLILEDGTAIERSPEAQFQIVHELVSISAMFTALGLATPTILQEKIKKTCAVLRAFCHHDGALSLFNGSHERCAKEIDHLLDRAERYRIISPILPNGGFVRLTSGRSLLLVDAASPPHTPFDKKAHAGTLSFEFSHDTQRILVNSGANSFEPFKSLLRESVAHNVITLNGESSSEFDQDGHIIRYPTHVTSDHYHQNGKDWLECFHDGYYSSHGATWHRQFYLANEGNELKGCDIIQAETAIFCTTRFYLHPSLSIKQEDDDIIITSSQSIWRFRSQGGIMTFENALYFGRGIKENNKQIVIKTRLQPQQRSTPTNHAPREIFTCRISWLLERVPN